MEYRVPVACQTEVNRRAGYEFANAMRHFLRHDPDIILVGASKMNDAAACQEAIAAGIDALGENRVQEMTAKLAENAYAGRPLHFIGHLQRNKVRQVVGKADLIQSVGSTELLQEITTLLARLAGTAGLERRASDGEDALHPLAAVVPRYFFYRAMSIYGGSSEVQKDILAKSALG